MKSKQNQNVKQNGMQKIKNFLSFKKNIFRIVAIVMIALFILIIIGGVLKEHSEAADRIPLNEQQIAQAKNIAAADMAERGVDIANYEAKVIPKLRKLNKGHNDLAVVQVTFNNQTENELYLLDLNSGKIIMRSESYYNPEFRSNTENDCSYKQRLDTEEKQPDLPCVGGYEN